MQVTEIVFLIFLVIAILKFVAVNVLPKLKYSYLIYVGIGLLLLGILVEGWRWQMLPAYFAFGALILAQLKKSETSRIVKIVGTAPLVLLLIISFTLANQLPIFELPVPTGPQNVGTFEFSITDNSRVERYANKRNRELYVQAWYPAEVGLANNYQVRTLYQEIYEGEYNIWSFLAGYLRHIPTHSYIEAPIANFNGKPFPVLLYNHGARSFTSENQMLMEHLASNGYVIFSIGHPYRSVKTNLANAGSIGWATEQPSDIPFRVRDLDFSLLDQVMASGASREESSAMRAVLLELADNYATASDESVKLQILISALQLDIFEPYSNFVTEDLLRDYLVFVHGYQHRDVEYFVEDTQFIASSISEFDFPVPNFFESLDSSGFGLFGLSLGGATAGEFCKIDSRCLAGVNLDGTQFGRNWRQKVNAPFLMVYNEEHQGGNDYAYLPPSHEYWDYTIRGTEHFDFAEFGYIAPGLKALGFAGSIDSARMTEIINTLVLNFFDHYLKGAPISGELFSDIPEIDIRVH